MGTGTLEARVKTTVSARIQERLAEVLVDQGDKVKAGQLLARLDDAESSSRSPLPRPRWRRRDKRRSGCAPISRARRRCWPRRGWITSGSPACWRPMRSRRSDADKAAEALRVAEADLKRSHAAIAEAAGPGRWWRKKRCSSARSSSLSREIHSPYDGLIIRRDRDPGDVLVPGGSLMQIISLDESGSARGWMKRPCPARGGTTSAHRFPLGEPTRSYPGMVSRLGREMDRETREFLVDVRVTELPKNWTIGQRAEVFIETGRQADAVLLPPAFLVWKAGTRRCLRECRRQGAVARGHARFARQGSRRHHAGIERG